MKIGIMSMQRVVNCGSFLQAFGLKKIIKSLGHDVIFVDYKVERPFFKNREDVSFFRKSVIRNFIILFLSNCPFIFWLLPKEVRYSIEDRRNYEKIYFKELGLTKNRIYSPKIDTLVIGSDEVFNCLQLNPEVGYSPELFGKNNNAKRVITYAASFGNTTFDEIVNAGKKDEIRQYLMHMNALSVRDTNTLCIVKRMIGKLPSYNLDPVLIYGFKDEIPDLNISDDYVLIYAYRRRIKYDEAVAIKAFAEKQKLRLISVGGYQPFCDENIVLSPFEVLGYFKKAQYVFTDTFHGTIFSIINHRQFATIVRDGHGKEYGNSEKLNDLLITLGLSNRKITNIKVISKVIQTKIDYEGVDTILEKERRRTIEYLKANL